MQQHSPVESKIIPAQTGLILILTKQKYEKKLLSQMGTGSSYCKKII
jgi:hypothetical protein